jgi:hypothetical protein
MRRKTVILAGSETGGREGRSGAVSAAAGAAGESSERSFQKSSEIGSLNCEFFFIIFLSKRKNVKIKAGEKHFFF